MIAGEPLLALIPKPAAVVTDALEVSFANGAFAALWPDDAQAGPPASLTRALAAAADLAAPLARVLGWLKTSGRSSVVSWQRGAGGSTQAFRVHVTRLPEGGALLLFDEVSELVQIEEIQTRARTYVEGVLNNLDRGVIVLDREFRVTFFNHHQSQIFDRVGVDASMLTVIGEPVAERFPVLPAEEWAAVRTQVAVHGELVTRVRVPYPAHAPLSYFAMTIVPHVEASSGEKGAVCITEDLTRLVALEDELVRHERVATVAQLVLSLNHEINNPLQTVLGTADVLVYSKACDGPVLDRIVAIREAALRIAEVVGRLKEISWPPAPQR
jgi:nitrogen-specific signal transduction histidine kinase